VVKTYLKTLVRVFQKHIARFLSIIFMVLVSVGFIAGIGGSTNKVDQSLSNYYKAQNVSDLILKSKRDEGFTQEEADAVRALYGEENVNAGNSVDVNLTVGEEEQLVRLYFLKGKRTVNTLHAVKSDAPTVVYERPVSAERQDNRIKGVPVGTEITLNFKDVVTQLAEQGGKEPPAQLALLPDKMATVTVTVAEIVTSPISFAVDGEISYTNPENAEVPDSIGGLDDFVLLDNILYLSTDVIPVVFGNALLPAAGDLYVALPDREAFDAFSRGYRPYLEQEAQKIAAVLSDGDYRALTLYDNYSFVSLHAYGEKVMEIGIVLMVAFLFITALVVLSNMTRLMEEERAQIACLRTLGYDGFRIVFKYILFAMLATGIGGVGAYFVGIGLASMIYYVFNYSFDMPPMSASVMLWFFLVTYFVIVITTLLATLLAGHRMTREKPADLLRPKVPKAGKKVILERIPFLWNKLSFKYKSTMRNVLRYKSRFLMTVIAVAGSMGLVLAGLALLDLCLFGNFGSPSIMALAVIIVIFAGLLTAVVIYTLTNINVSERNREIATLMVLGYFDKEVTGYIYREIYVNTVVGILFGYPAGLLLMWFVFSIIGFGAIASVSWFVWLIAPFITLLFTFLVTLALRRKIVKIDMNESLKAIE
jgi:putative ABC transport system permease protein